MTKRNSKMLARATVRRATTVMGPSMDELLPSWRRKLTTGLTVFIFHEITAAPSPFHLEAGTYTSPKVFADQLAWIADRFAIIDPVTLEQLGGSGDLPPNAALLTFDDAWAGVFRVGLPMLKERGFGALLFLNMATVHGEPDLGAVRKYERSNPQAEQTLGQSWLGDRAAGLQVLDRVRDRYRSDPDFRAYQGPTATCDDLTNAVRNGGAWFGSHLYHHWDIPSIAEDIYQSELEENADALASYANALPAFATPNGYSGGGRTEPFAIPMQYGMRAIFTGTGSQNSQVAAPILDRVFFPTEPTTHRQWWYATHRRRILGPRTS